MSTNLLIFIFASVLQGVIFTFSLLLLRSKTQKPSKLSITGYSETAAIKIAELEGAITQLKLSFQDVIDRVEKWTKRDSQRERIAERKAELILPTDLPSTEGVPALPVAPAAPTNSKDAEFARLRKIRGF